MLIGVEAADERMGFQKVQLRRWPGQFQQRTQVTQSPCAMMQGFLRGGFQRLDGMFLGQRQQAVQDPARVTAARRLSITSVLGTPP